ncbi:fumarylacetoacetate hydrolase family protein [Olivibacter ginsenosidimutans]|uniref:Fumarylacetoacetate hydrolase family protein n=1 Tax=Olivibacter ginsenosidimutans TaxID=1176537 RepID=A0ABP9BMN4_9SPHI
MKIIAIGRNYAEHAQELNNPIPDKPVIFLKPDTALLKDNKDFYIPDFSTAIQHEIEIVLRICKEGKHISKKFASNYYDAIGLGIDFTARDIQTDHKKQGLPWELAKAFDHSAVISKFVDKSAFPALYDLNFSLYKNGSRVQHGNTKHVIFSFEHILSFISEYITLRKGDFIYTGTPAGVGSVAIGDHLEGYIEDIKLLDFHIK